MLPMYIPLVIIIINTCTPYVSLVTISVSLFYHYVYLIVLHVH